MEAVAARLGVIDALLFRRLSPTAWVHLGGVGRGRAWAVVVDVHADDPLVADVPAQPGAVHLFTHPQPARVLGPYYAVGGALVRVDNDVLAVLGNPVAALAPQASAIALRKLAGVLDRGVGDVAPSKRLADELEVLRAVQAVTTNAADDLPGTLQRVVDIAMEALSCEGAVLRDGAGHVASTCSSPDVNLLDPQIGAALDALQRSAATSSLCIQDTEDHPVPAPLGRGQSVRSLLAISIPAPVGGVLVVAHASLRPRGFTALCQRLGRHVADAAAVVARTAGLRDELLAAGEEHARTARRDPLTELGLGRRVAGTACPGAGSDSDLSLCRTPEQHDKTADPVSRSRRFVVSQCCAPYLRPFAATRLVPGRSVTSSTAA